MYICIRVQVYVRVHVIMLGGKVQITYTHTTYGWYYCVERLCELPNLSLSSTVPSSFGDNSMNTNLHMIRT